MNSSSTLSLRGILVITVFLLIGGKLLSQAHTLNGYVLDEQNLPVEGATVFVNNKQVIKKTATGGLFTLEVHLHDTILVQKERSKDQFVVEGTIAQDSLLVVFQLFNKSLILDEVIISRSRVKKFDGEKNEYLLDYYVYEDGSYITLKRSGKEHFLEFIVNGISKNRFKLDFQPMELTIDCKANSMILSADSVYQFWMDEKLHFSNVFPRREYERNIKNLVYCGDSMFVDYSYTNHNKSYHLNYYDKDTSYCFLTIYDTLGFYTISEQISAYKAQTCPLPRINDSIPLKYQYIVNSQNRSDLRNPIIRPKNDPMFIAVQVDDVLNVQSMRVNLNIVTVDFEKSVLYVFNKMGKTVHTARIEGEKNEKNRLLRDPYTDKFYVIDPNRPALGVSSLDLENGNLEEILVLKEVFYPEKIKIFNNALYFIAANSKGFQKVYMVNLVNSVN